MPSRSGAQQGPVSGVDIALGLSAAAAAALVAYGLIQGRKIPRWVSLAGGTGCIREKGILKSYILLAFNSAEAADSMKQLLCRLQPLTREQWLAMPDSAHRLSTSLPVLLDHVRKGVS